MPQQTRDPFTSEELLYRVQFFHPEKVLAWAPGMSEAMCARLLAIDEAHYRQLRASFAENARQAARDLLADPVFAARVERLPFAPGSTVVGLGDSITDDYQSWLEILRHLLALQRPQDNINVVNAAVTGQTTAQMIGGFLGVVQLQPDWIICMAGTNDARLHGLSPTKTLVSIEETAKNFAMLDNFAATQTAAKWVWMTPAVVIEGQIQQHWFMSTAQLAWRNEDLAAVAEIVRRQPGPVVDVQALFGTPANPTYLMPDGVHPSLAGQKAIVRALVERLSE